MPEQDEDYCTNLSCVVITLLCLDAFLSYRLMSGHFCGQLSTCPQIRSALEVQPITCRLWWLITTGYSRQTLRRAYTAVGRVLRAEPSNYPPVRHHDQSFHCLPTPPHNRGICPRIFVPSASRPLPSPLNSWHPTYDRVEVFRLSSV